MLDLKVINVFLSFETYKFVAKFCEFNLMCTNKYKLITLQLQTNCKLIMTDEMKIKMHFQENVLEQ